jgi:acyl carrier protein
MKSRQQIVDWCIRFISETFDLPAEEVYLDAEFQSFGFDSTALVGFAAELEEWLGMELPPSVLFEHPSIGQLASHLSGEQP